MIEYNREYDEILRRWVEEFPRSYFKKIKSKANSHILKYIEDCTPLLSDEKYLISTKVFWVLNKIQNFPKCEICGTPITKNIKVTEGYPSHCSAQCLSDDPKVKEHKRQTYEKLYGQGVTNPFQSKEVIEKITKTNIERYGVKRFTQTEKYRNFITENHDIIENKKHTTHKENKSFHTSKPEEIAYGLLKKKYPDLTRQYSSPEFPHSCDFYVPSKKLFIEYNGSWTHGGHPFDPDDPKDVEKLEDWRQKSRHSHDYYANAIYTWTDLDIRKLKEFKEKHLNFKIFWNLDEIYKFVVTGYGNLETTEKLVIPYDRKTLDREFAFYKNHAPLKSFPGYPSLKNEIVKFFQQDVFFKRENQIWKNDSTKRNRLIQNRLKYTKKNIDELSCSDILTGFKKSGIYYGYSHFNPLWFRWFLEKFDVKTCYDPCGGWGHRILGALNTKLYIYNDLSKSTVENVRRIVDYFKISNVKIYNNDAQSFFPEENFDAMFTCPPYFNLEEYECGKFKDMADFSEFIDGIFDVFDRKKSCRVFGLVIREDFLEKHLDYSEKYEITMGEQKKYFSNKTKTFKEYLYIFKK